MKIVCIGAGNVATRLATALYEHKFDIIQVYSHTYTNAHILAQKVGAMPIANLTEIIADADVYLFSIKDAVLEHVLEHLPKTNGLCIHTAGSLPMDIFANYTKRYGVLYPFQTLSKERNIDWRRTPLFIECSNSEDYKLLVNIAKQLSDKVCELSSERRRYIHLTGVFACNFTNHMYALSQHFLEKANLPFAIALPLIDETCAKVHELNPSDAQTGPAVRFDQNVISKHLDLIDDERVRDIYKLISENIHITNQNK